MATKVVYFTVGGRHEQAEFRSDDSTEEIRETFRAAAEAGPNDILKLYNQKGNLVNIAGKLAENSPSTRYKLDVVASILSGHSIASQLGVNASDMESRLQSLEKRMLVENGHTPQSLIDIKHKVESFREKLEGVEHLSWLGLFKDISSGTSLQPFWNKKNNCKGRNEEHYQRVFDKYRKMSQVQVTESVRVYLRKPTFDNWQWDDAEILVLLQQMYIDLDILSNFNIELKTLQQWLYEVYTHYNSVPFHNFKHCFMVAQMMYGLTWLIDLRKYLNDIDILILITSAICHDLDHPGYNNAYQINARTELALMYNDISPLENHHCAVAFEILEKPHANIFQHLPVETFKRIREGMIRCILATDMAKHSEILNNFKSITKSFDFNNKEHKGVLMMILMKVSDISNEARPMEVAEPWLDCLLQEFFNQLMMVLMKVADVSNEARPLEVAEPWFHCLMQEFFTQLMMIIIKMADISNEARPMEVAEPWLECLLEEYFQQSDMEKLEGLPVAPFMDREKVSKSSSQVGFIKFVLLPLFESLGELFPVIEDDIIDPVRKALDYYTEMQKALEEEKVRKLDNERDGSSKNGMTTPKTNGKVKS